MNEDFLYRKISARIADNSLRVLKPRSGGIDFCSNDYLGIATNKLIPDLGGATGSTGSRLLTGNGPWLDETELMIAGFHQAETALLFNSGYDANLGLLSSVPQRGDLILYDQLVHASIRDGVRLSFAEAKSFAHNDLQDLEEKMKAAGRQCFVVTESVFSMDGDLAPLREIAALCEQYEAALIVDEAHATGVVGERGEGLAQQLGIAGKCFARMHSFGKAVGVHGAVVLGSALLKSYLVNFARSQVYSTALSEQTALQIRAAYTLFPEMRKERYQIQRLVLRFASEELDLQRVASPTAIQAVLLPGNEECRRMATSLQAQGLDIRPILYPTVPKGAERLRVILHAFNTEAELDNLLNCLKNRR